LSAKRRSSSRISAVTRAETVRILLVPLADGRADAILTDVELVSRFLVPKSVCPIWVRENEPEAEQDQRSLHAGVSTPCVKAARKHSRYNRPCVRGLDLGQADSQYEMLPVARPASRC
jgi:hypothetical protein